MLYLARFIPVKWRFNLVIIKTQVFMSPSQNLTLTAIEKMFLRPTCGCGNTIVNGLNHFYDLKIQTCTRIVSGYQRGNQNP